MTPIDMISTSERFAREQTALENFKRIYDISPLGQKVAVSLAIQNVIPQPSALSILIGYDKKTNFMTFCIPPNWLMQRSNSPYPAQSLGPQAELEAHQQMVLGFMNQTKAQFSPDAAREIEQEGNTIVAGIQEMKRMWDISDQLIAHLYGFLSSR